MAKTNLIFLTILFFVFLKPTFSQSNENIDANDIEKTISLTKDQHSSAAAVSPEKIKDTVNTILMNNKAVSLMFDDEENSNIDRAVDSLKNNQTYVPDSDVATKEMTEEEKKALAQKAEEEEKKKLENEKSYAYLASIIYLSPKEWVIWINQKKITSKTNSKNDEIYIRSVEEGRVKGVWRIAISKWKILSGKNSESLAPKINSNNQVEIEFTLKPNQAFSLIANKVIEGRGGAALQN